MNRARLRRTSIVGGKLVAALSLWFAAFAIAAAYVWFLGRGIGIVGDAVDRTACRRRSRRAR